MSVVSSNLITRFCLHFYKREAFVASSSQQDQNDGVSVSIHKKEECRVELEVKAPKECVLKARKQAIKSVSKEISLPGFRKGKAPEDLVIKKYPSAFEEEWKKAIADISFAAAQKAAAIPAMNPQTSIRYNIKNYSLESGAELTFTYETEPDIPSIDLSSFKIAPIDRPEAGAKQIEEAIRQTRFFYAKWQEVLDRPIQKGDYVILDLDSMEGETPQTVFTKTRFEVSDEGMAQWMQKLLIGAKLHDAVEGMSFPDEDVPEEEKKTFEPKKVRITIQKIEEATLPPLDDEFAKKLGMNSVQDLENWMKIHLNKQADEKVASEKHAQACHFLLNHATFELPSSLIVTEKNYRIRSSLENPRFKERWDKMSKEEKESIERNITQEAIEAIKLFYISRKIIEDAHIHISQQDVVQEASALFAEKHGRAAHPQDIEKDLYALAFSRLILAKAEEHLLNLGSWEQKA